MRWLGAVRVKMMVVVLVLAAADRSLAQTGACCQGAACSVTTSSICTLQNGDFMGVGTICSPSPCSGACCASNGTCQVLSLIDCRADFLAGQACAPNPCSQPRACCAASGVCSFIAPTGCGGTPMGPGSTCAPNPCPQPARACCSSAGACTFVTAAACSAGGGTALGLGTTCSPNPCPGACCAVNGACTLVSSSSCASAGGFALGAGSVCGPDACFVRACCTLNGSCTLQSAHFNCPAGGSSTDGAFNGSSCTPTTCTSVIGVCCTDGSGGAPGSCVTTTLAGCSGSFLPGVSCIAQPCPVACCETSGICHLTPLSACQNAGGSMIFACAPNGFCGVACCAADGTCTIQTQGCPAGRVEAGVTCGPATCQPRACCRSDFSCTVVSALFTCAGGTFGFSDTCGPNACLGLVGACCGSFATCSMSTFGSCTDSFVSGQTCQPNPCPAPCCLPGAGCVGMGVGACEAAGGTPFIVGNCNCTGACCATDTVGCLVMQATDCAALGLRFLGSQTTCQAQSCPPHGACCAPGGACAVGFQSACAGVFLGRGSVCSPAAASGTLNPCCRGDFNGSGAATVQDIFDFLAAYFAGC